MLTAYLVRHGENQANITKEFSYKLVDYPLTQKGVMQSKQTAEYFDDIGIKAIYASPLRRAIETANIINERLKVKITILEQFREVNVGDLEKEKPSFETWKIHNSINEKWLNGNYDLSFPNGETKRQLVNRFIEGLRIINNNNTDGNILIVGHGMNFVQGVMELCKIENQIDFYSIKNYNCSISKIMMKLNDDGFSAQLLFWASIKHLHGIASEVTESLVDTD
jgi:broad specificity phosphatase PhoE